MILLTAELDQIILLLGDLIKELYFQNIMPSDLTFDLIFDSIQSFGEQLFFLVNLENQSSKEFKISKDYFKSSLKNKSRYIIALNSEFSLVFDFKFYICYLECSNNNFISDYLINSKSKGSVRTPTNYEHDSKKS